MSRILIVLVLVLSVTAMLAMDFGGPALTSPSQPELQRAPDPEPVYQRLSYNPAKGPEPVRVNISGPVLDPRQAEARWEKIESLLQCEEKGNCGVAEADARAESFAVRDSLLAEAQWFLSHVPATPEQVKRSRTAAALLLAFPDEQVQGLALQWILRLPAEQESLELLRENLSDMVDPDLARLTMRELARHMGTPREGAALDIVEKLLFEGGIFASREVARSMDIIVTNGNRERVERWASELNPESAKARLMRESLTLKPGV